jgi:hypothetical protein
VSLQIDALCICIFLSSFHETANSCVVVWMFLGVSVEEGEEGEEGAGFWSSHALKKAHNEVHRLSVSAMPQSHG